MRDGIGILRKTDRVNFSTYKYNALCVSKKTNENALNAPLSWTETAESVYRATFVIQTRGARIGGSCACICACVQTSDMLLFSVFV